ncbi:MAG: hypothetical protein ABIR30_05735 [Chitinophagaceae bacterium]
MKKIFTLFTGLLMAAALSAADHRPVVTVSSFRNYKIVIDGRTYFDNDMTFRLSNLQRGYHSIKVFEMQRRGYMGRYERLVATSSFQVGRKDVNIRIDRFGNIRIYEDRRNGRFDNDRDWNDRNNDREYDYRNDRDNDHRDNRNDRF